MEGRQERDRISIYDIIDIRLTIKITYHKNELELIVELVFKTQGLVGE